MRSNTHRWTPVAGVTAVALVGSILVGLHALPKAGWRPAAPQHQTSVPGHNATAGKVAASKVRSWTAAPVRWPAAGTLTEGGTRIDVFDQATSAKVGVSGVVVRVAQSPTGTGTQPVSLNYSGFRDAYGGDWSARLGLVSLPDCALTTPDSAACRMPRPVASHNDQHAGRVTADVPASGGVYALAATAGGGTGDYTATSLSPSATWQVSQQSGDFDWTYDMRTPAAPDSGSPSVSLDYSAQSVDGRTASTNNQTSWVGEGWNLWSGYVERSYMSCSDNGGPSSNGDECWNGDNATISLNGKATELIRDDTTGTWRLKDDDGSRVERFTGASNGDNDGEYWRVTTTDGTQYYFGLNHLPGWTSGKTTTDSTWTVPVYGNNSGEPCHGSTFASSSCQQAWRWNLDYVVDPHGNAASYLYTAETNYYRRGYDSSTGSNGTMTSYTRGGYLKEIDYGQQSNTMYTASPLDKVVFGVSERCLPDSTFDCATTKFTKANASHWPDVPYDENCSSTDSCTTNISPSFWSRKRLTGVTTSVLVGTTYQNVDTWALDESFPAPGDGTTPSLWLDKITHTGNVNGSLSVPPVVFGPTQLQNRVDTVGDSLAPLDKFRIGTIDTETGGHLSITYSQPECTASAKPDPATNAQRCFPQYWSGDPPQSTPFQDWFHKYVVTQVVQADLTGGAPGLVTTYSYLDTPAWHYNNDPLTKDKERTWGDWRGYSKVRVVTGAAGQPQSQTDYLYFRGMNGDRADATDATKTKTVSITDSTGQTLPDDDPRNGFQREAVEANGPGGAVVTDTIDDPWTLQTAKHVGSVATTTANLLDTGVKRVRTGLAAGGWQTTETDDSYDNNGLPTQTNDLGDTTTSADDQCTRTTYAQNTSAWMLAYVSREETVAVACTATPNRPDDVISDQRTYYDGQAFGAPPTKGDDTTIENIASYSGSTPVYVTAKTTAFDSYGRVTKSTDALGRATTTDYTPASGGLATRMVVKDNLGYATTSDINPAVGQATDIVDDNGKRSDLSYDPLGRLTQVWLPGRAKSANPTTPNLAYGYQVNGSSGPSAVSSSELRANGSYATSYQLYDGLLRERQSQAPAPGGGRIVTDRFYDSRGLVVRTNEDYYNGDSAPSAALFLPSAVAPGQTVTSYDGVGRPIVEQLLADGNLRWETTATYGGDRVSVTPPAGGTATTRISDARGRLVQLLQYHGGQPTGPADTVQYTYAKDGQIASLTDAAGDTWRYHYDLRGRKTSVDDPDTGTTVSTFDDGNQVLTITDSSGATLAFSYDGLGRKTGEYLGSTSGAKLAQWDYDILAKGELTDSIRFSGGQEYINAVTGYDDRYQPTGTTLTIPATEGTLGKKYTAYMTHNTSTDDTPHSITYPAAGNLAGETVTVGYDELGEPTTLTGLANYVSGTTYSKIGLLSQESGSDGNGHLVIRTNTYEDGTNRLTRVYDERSTSPTPVNDTHYSYYDSGDVKSVANTPSGQPSDIQCFGYDYLQRLASAWTTDDSTCGSQPAAGSLGTGPAPYWQTFTYDSSGNRTGETDHATTTGGVDVTHTYAYPAPGSAQPHTLRSVTTTGGPNDGRVDSYGYNTTGDTISRTLAGDPQTLSWDAEGQLASATKDGKTSTFLYDADGNLLLRRDPDATTLYVDGEEVTATTGGTVSTTRYYKFEGATIAARTGGGLSWLLADRQGTADTTVSGDSSQVVTRRYYTPYGQVRGAAPATWPGDKGYVGGIVDDAANLNVLGAREYDADTGRFLSADPVFDEQDPQSWNGYAYANDNPSTHSDPSGLMIPCSTGAGGCGTTGYMGGAKHPRSYCDTHDCNPGPSRRQVRAGVFRSNRAWNAYQRALAARWARIEAPIEAAKRAAERRAAEAQKARNHHHGRSWWDTFVGTVNVVSTAVTLIAVATSYVPGLDVASAGVAMGVDMFSAVVNVADAGVQIYHHHWERAAISAGTAVLSMAGAGAAGKAFKARKAARAANTAYFEAKTEYSVSKTGTNLARRRIAHFGYKWNKQYAHEAHLADVQIFASVSGYEAGHIFHDSQELNKKEGE